MHNSVCWLGHHSTCSLYCRVDYTWVAFGQGPLTNSVSSQSAHVRCKMPHWEHPRTSSEPKPSVSVLMWSVKNGTSKSSWNFSLPTHHRALAAREDTWVERFQPPDVVASCGPPDKESAVRQSTHDLLLNAFRWTGHSWEAPVASPLPPHDHSATTYAQVHALAVRVWTSVSLSGRLILKPNLCCVIPAVLPRNRNSVTGKAKQALFSVQPPDRPWVSPIFISNGWWRYSLLSSRMWYHTGYISTVNIKAACFSEMLPTYETAPQHTPQQNKLQGNMCHNVTYSSPRPQEFNLQ